MNRLSEVKKPIIYLITKGNLTEENYTKESSETLHIIKIATATQVSMIQIREKKLPPKLIIDLTKKVINITNNSNIKILVNDRIDIALATGADGVHLTSNSIPTDLIRSKSPRDFIIGVSTHSIKEAKSASKDGADFVTFSPIFPTKSKINYGAPKGLKKLIKLCGELKSFPVLALGGINENNYQMTLENGAEGFAGISLLNDEDKLKHNFIRKK